LKSLEFLQECVKNIEAVSQALSKAPEEIRGKTFGKVDEIRNNLNIIIKEITVDNEELAKFLNSRSEDLKRKVSSLRKDNFDDFLKELNEFLRFSRTAIYDFTGRLSSVRKAYRAYLYGMIDFFVLSGFFGPQFAITALILVIPVLLSVFNVRKRRALGLTFVYVTTPIPLVMGFIAVRYGFYALTTPEELVSVASILNITLELATLVVALILALGVAEVILITYAAVTFYKNRHAFI